MANPEYVYVTVIAAAPDAVWRAITTPEFTCQYWHQSRVESRFVGGSPIRFFVDGEVVVEGEILVADCPRELSYTWQFLGLSDCKSEKPSRVTFTIDEIEQGSRLTIVHDQFDEKSRSYELVRQGWPLILGGLKTLLETGNAVDFTNKA